MINLTNVTVEKAGDSQSLDESSFYGLNAGIGDIDDDPELEILRRQPEIQRPRGATVVTSRTRFCSACAANAGPDSTCIDQRRSAKMSSSAKTTPPNMAKRGLSV